MNPQAEELNNTIKSSSETVYSLLSSKGKSIFFPKKGILAQTAEAKGKNINATIGAAVEDDGSPMRLPSIQKMITLEPSEAFPYAPSFGHPLLRQQWKKIMLEKNPSLAGETISLPVVSNALTHGLSMAAYLFVEPGEKIILPDLFWGNYKLLFINGYGAELDTFNTFSDGFDVAALSEKLSSEGEKMVVLLNFPNNPTGYTPTIEEAKEIVSSLEKAAVSGKKIVVLIDDAYFGLVYEDGVEKQSLFSYLCGLHENILAVKIDGATKEDYVWGFRVGFLTFGIKEGTPELYTALEAKTAGAIRGNISNVSHLSQSLLLNAYRSESYPLEKQEKYDLLKSRYDEVKNELAEHPEYAKEFVALPFNSGYFMCVRLLKADAEEVRQKLLAEYDTGVIALGDIIRIAFSAVAKEDIAELFSNLHKACGEV
jgi:aspartate/methionine/tyrosine aminotransferase